MANLSTRAAKLSVSDIYEYLDERVAGQKEAKQAIATAGFLHTAKSLKSKAGLGIDVKSSNVLITGPSGCGKTYIVQLLCEYMNVPLLEINARSLSLEGYKGSSFEERVDALYSETSLVNRSRLNYMIVFIDEFDKVTQAGASTESWDLSLQHSLLKFVEGSKLDVSVNTIEPAHTKNMLFIFGGNFANIRKARKDRETPQGIGFSSVPCEKHKGGIHTELIKQGVIKELVGRISIMTEVQDLTRKELKAAFKSVEGGIYQQYQELYSKVFNTKLNISNYHIEKILNSCVDKGIGARGLHAALDDYINSRTGRLRISTTKFSRKQLSTLRFA